MINMYETLIFAVFYISILFLFSSRSETRQAFVATWNVPSEVCSQKFNIEFDLKQFRIDSNKNTSFMGEEVVLFYEPLPGLYPKYLSNGSALNGGIPQRVPFDHHFQKVANDIDVLVPAKDFLGKGVIDWESWRPIFERNTYEPDKLIYINESKKLAKSLYPAWNSTMIGKMADIMFEESARKLMEKTLMIARDLRPRGSWGFYGFPRCFNYEKDEDKCSKETMKFNDQLSWLFRASKSLYPSIYLSSKFPSPSSRQKRVQGILNETLRVHSRFSTSNTRMHAYSTYRYTDNDMFYSQEDLINSIGQSFDAGMDGVILWDSSKNFKSRADCQNVKDYLQFSLGPLVKKVIDFAEKCGAGLCSGHGKCVRNSWVKSTGLQLFLAHSVHVHVYDFENYECKCYKGWLGTQCNQPS